MSAFWFGETFLCKDTPHLDLRGLQKAFQREHRNDHGRHTHRPRQVAACHLADRERKERHQL